MSYYPTFRDGKRTIDFILVYKISALVTHNAAIRHRAFILALQTLGLEMEYESFSVDVDIMFIKLYLPDDFAHSYAGLFDIELACTSFQFRPYMVPPPAAFSSPLTRPNVNDPIYTRAPQSISGAIPKNITSAERIMVVNQILNRVIWGEERSEYGVTKLIKAKVILDAFPLHDGHFKWTVSGPLNDRQLLALYWGSFRSWRKAQPINLVEKYFGTEYALYFAWLGFYIKQLVPAAILSVFVLVYGLVTMFTKLNRHTQDICQSRVVMCPRCHFADCPMELLSNSCYLANVSYVFDNWCAVIYSGIMTLWGECPYGDGYRSTVSTPSHDLHGTLATRGGSSSAAMEPGGDQRRHDHQAGVFRSGHKEEVQSHNGHDAALHPSSTDRLQIHPHVGLSLSSANNHDFSNVWRDGLSGISERGAHQVQIHSAHQEQIPKLNSVDNWRDVIGGVHIHFQVGEFQLPSGSSACQIGSLQFYEQIALMLTNLENHRSQQSYTNSFIFKSYALAFANNYAAVFYIAFFKGKFFTYPGDLAVFSHLGGINTDVCDPTGCIVDLAILLITIMVIKAFISNITQVLVPKLRKVFNQTINRVRSQDNIPQWEDEYLLAKSEEFFIVGEYMDMVIQYGFVNFFIMGFPLAPLLALINNVAELRVDASKVVKSYRRPIPTKVASLGAWFGILQATTYIGVVTNALVIAFTSTFMEKVIWETMAGHSSEYSYLNESLSVFAMNDFEIFDGSIDDKLKLTKVCYYEGKRYPPNHPLKYKRRKDYWLHLAIKFAAVVIFEHVLVVIKGLVAYAIPDVPFSVRQQIAHQEKMFKRDRIIEQSKKFLKDREKYVSIK
ncbi:anoctamin-4 isoform X1 [Dendroctonus ponderosae]|uniref:anoctamin-4 isoform X1 n=1 Tax=Dendroctonus ponderosae TaxID=77166 RepID=UPI0020360606|nr:anoctamin-4 isoform X1 [Dendroctonus ponderosae]